VHGCQAAARDPRLWVEVYEVLRTIVNLVRCSGTSASLVGYAYGQALSMHPRGLSTLYYAVLSAASPNRASPRCVTQGLRTGYFTLTRSMKRITLARCRIPRRLTMAGLRRVFRLREASRHGSSPSAQFRCSTASQDLNRYSGLGTCLCQSLIPLPTGQSVSAGF
jgi:hypothetical protein